jgi:hypothetical protein
MYEVFLRNELPGLLEDIPLMVRSQMYFQHDGSPAHFSQNVSEYLNESFPNRWFGGKCVVLLIVIEIVIFCIVICDCGFFILFCDTLTEVFSGFFPQL